jgi:predicted TIM-barrel fold metal-dependent hydrolase
MLALNVAVRDERSTSISQEGRMRIVTLEEHFLVPPLVDRYFGLGKSMTTSRPELTRKTGDLGEGRLRDMDECGITVQVVSASMPGASELDGEDGIKFARETNEELGRAVRRHPNRLAGFATLPMRTPEAAADELERAVRDHGFRGAMINGMTDGRFLDDSRFEPVLARCEALDVPFYLHPNLPPKAVMEAYYTGFSDWVNNILASGAIGWHSETAIHIFRLALSGALDRHPRLKVIIGHMGEILPFQLARADDVWMSHCGLERPVSEVILDHVYITTSGFFTDPPFQCALATFGADRILFSVDYPYSSNARGRAFLDSLSVSPADKIKIAHGNADRVLKLNPNDVS